MQTLSSSFRNAEFHLVVKGSDDVPDEFWKILGGKPTKIQVKILKLQDFPDGN